MFARPEETRVKPPRVPQLRGWPLGSLTGPTCMALCVGTQAFSSCWAVGTWCLVLGEGALGLGLGAKLLEPRTRNPASASSALSRMAVISLTV
jgi:hypothetical protein